MRKDLTIIDHDWQNNTSVMEYEVGFFGKCYGIALARRGLGDPHVAFHIVTEDDGTWHIIQGSGSSFWLPDLIAQLNAAHDWLKVHAIEGPWGYAFK